MALTLKINIVHAGSTKTMQFNPGAIVYDVLRMIREKNAEAGLTDGQQVNEYGLFLADDDPLKGVWLESGKTLEHYLLRQGDTLEYRKKIRPLRVNLLDGSVKTVLIDDSNTVSQMLITISTKLGITNYDEYSLCRDTVEEEVKKDATINRSTLKKEKKSALQQRDETRMQELRKKHHTDDELEWLDHTRTLREQGVPDTEHLIFRRKYFFSDQNVDRRDPVQLNLLYVQSRDAILNGTHPCSFEEATQLAGTMCQIQYGDHLDHKHKPGFLDLKEFMPREYVKVKGVEKKIFQEHRNLHGVSELDSKVRYTQLCRSLKTYGITFFLVKEKMRGKNKLVPRLMGITKESVVRVDERTKEILKTWPLTTVKRWAASPKSFTLDFGDYSDSYYSVQTTEGEAIGALIAGYIDIILKKQKGKDRLGMEGDEEATLLEDSVSPAKATYMHHHSTSVGHGVTGSVAMPGVMRTGGSVGNNSVTMGEMQRSQPVTIQGQAHAAHQAPLMNAAKQPGLTTAQQALKGTIQRSMTDFTSAKDSLAQETEIQVVGQDPVSQQWRQNQIDVQKQNIQSQLSAMSAATAGVISRTSAPDEEIDYNAVGSHVTTISTNLSELTKGVKMLSSLLEKDGGGGDDIMNAARSLMDAFADLLKAAEPDSSEPRQNLINAANKVGEAQNKLLKSLGDVGDVDPKFQDALLGLAKAVANATSDLVMKAKHVAGQADSQDKQNKVIGSATQCALHTSQLVACTKVVAPTISSPACQEQLVEAAKLVAKSVEGVVDSSKDATEDENLLKNVGDAATAVTKALNDLLMHVKQGTSGTKQNQVYEESCDRIMVATEKLFSSVGNVAEMVKQAKVLAQATSQLVNAIKLEAEGLGEGDSQKRLLNAAKVLADATARMVEAAKLCAKSPQDPAQQEKLIQAAENLRNVTNAAAAKAQKKRVLQQLENAAKNNVAAATQCIAAAQGAERTNRNKPSHQALIAECRSVVEHIPELVQGIKSYGADTECPASQMNLINASQNYIQPGTKMVLAAKAAIPFVADQAAGMQLNKCAKNMATALNDLRTASTKAQEACGDLEIDSAMDMIRAQEDELKQIKLAAQEHKLLPLPGETTESCAGQLGATSKGVGASMAQLLTAAAQGNKNHTGIAARDTANALKNLTGAVRGVAATTPDRKAQDELIDHAMDIMDKSANLLNESKKALANPNDASNQQRLAQVAKAVSHALNNCVNCLPGQKDVDSALRAVTEASKGLATGKYPDTSNKSYPEHQAALSKAAQGLNVSSSKLVTATRGTPVELSTASIEFTHDFRDMMDAGMGMARVAPSKEAQSNMVTSLKAISVSSSKLLLSVKSMSIDPGAANAKNQLAAAAKAVTEAINDLINTFMQSAPGQQECDNSLRKIATIKNILDDVSGPVNDASYFDCLDTVMAKSKALGGSMAGITRHAKDGELEGFGKSVESAGDAVCGLAEAAAQSAYLVGISDPSSVAGRPGLVDQSQFARAYEAIQAACNNLLNPTSNQQQVLAAATDVAKHTSQLCNVCRLASSKTSNPVAKKHFVQSAKDVANNTANLVKSIKALDGNFSEDNRQKCAASTKPLLEAVDGLVTFASSPEFASVPAEITPQAREAMEPIITAGKMMIASSSALIQTAKPLAANPKDPPTWQLLANHSKNVSDSIKKLIASIRDRAPGQHECDQSIGRINQDIRDLDQASLAAISQSLAPVDDNNLQGYTEQMANSVDFIKDSIGKVADAGKGQAEKLGHEVLTMANYFDPLTQNAIGAASKCVNSQQQMALLDQTKTVAECALQLLYAAREGGGNPKAKHTHSAIDEAAEGMKEAVDELNNTLEDAASQFGMVTGMVETISKAIIVTDDSITEMDGDFVDYQTNMVKSCKAIIKTAHDMVSKSNSDVGELGTLANSLSHEYANLAHDSRGARASASPEVGQRIKSSVQELGRSSMDLVKNAGMVQGNPTDSLAKRELVDSARSVSEKANSVMAALTAGSRGTQACINAYSTVSGIIGDLDTTIMFATAGTLNAEPDGTSFADHRESILKTAKALVEDTKTLVSGAASSQEELANAAQSAVLTITKLADVVKLGAATLGGSDVEGQVLLINAVKDVTSALGDLISATKVAAGKSINDPSMGQLKNAAKLELYKYQRSMEHLKKSAKVMVTNVTSLLKTVKSVEDEALRGTRALEATVDAVVQEARILQTPAEKKYTPEDLIRSTKPVTVATAKAVGAGNSCKQDDIIAASNLGRTAIFELLETCREPKQQEDSPGAAATAPTPEAKQRTLTAGQNCADSYRSLLQNVHLVIQKPTPEGKQKLVYYSKHVAMSVSEVVQAAEALKGPDWVDPEDPHVVAENELLGAAASIEAAAKKLAMLKPRRGPKAADENLNFEEQILEAAKCIANATSALVKAASAAQKELVLQGKVMQNPTPYSEDGQWSMGLISAAKKVAAATHGLCEAANSAVQGHASEERLISSAKQVASSTAQLLVACKVKADTFSEPMKRLQTAGNAVKRASDNLVKAAQQASQWAEEQETVSIPSAVVGNIAIEMDAMEAILRKEKELETARRKLEEIRKLKYKNREPGDSD
ncbi:talin-1-like isoform X3 [Anneissia japonica]|uniref:talin-1-like isoform X3 n=1 Tax=Anneissia japonica TaxID=1529436 RepID=UPI00142551FA|nr:talin-1-like isoform X3 [Anneissia japonica]